MWCTSSCARPLRQHFASRVGSHQQVSFSVSSFSQEVTLRHLMMSSPGKVGRCAVLMIALIVPGLFSWSVGIADVSDVPGRACANTCHCRLSVGIPDTRISEIREYWLPTSPLMLLHCGCS